jgi:hypothetical protein
MEREKLFESLDAHLELIEPIRAVARQPVSPAIDDGAGECAPAGLREPRRARRAGDVVRLAILFAALALTGCVGSFEEAHSAAVAEHRAAIKLGAATPARDDAHCSSLDSQHAFFVDAAWVDGSLAGASGAVAGALPSDVPKGWRIGLAISSAVTAALTVASTKAAVDTANEWAHSCGTVTP